MKKTHGFVILLVVVLTLLLLRRCQAPREELPPKVSFVLPAEGVQVGRDYNQRIFVSLKNSGPSIAKLRLQADSLPDLPSGFVGRGTEDWEVPGTVLEIPVGEIWDVPILVHADHAQRDDYALTLHATHLGSPVADAVLKLRITKPKLALETTWLDPVNPADRARLKSVLRIRNIGAPIGDLSVHFEIGGKPADHEVFWHPVVESARLVEAESKDVMVGPQLYPGFTKLAGEIVIRGLNQELRLPYTPQVPEGKSVFVTLSRTTSLSSNDSDHCTNRPQTTYTMPPTNGTPTGGGFSGGGPSGGGSSGGGGVTLTQPPKPPSVTPPKDEPKKDDDKDDGFGFLGVDPIPSTTTPDPKPETAATDPKKDNKDAKDKKDPKTTTTTPKPATPKPATPKPTTPALPKDIGGLGDNMRPLIPMNDGIMANLDSNARVAECGTMQLLDDEERKRLGLPPRPQPPKKDPLEGLKIPDYSHMLDALSRKDPDSPATHLVRREGDDGTEFLDFSFGIQEGQRLRVPIRMGAPISQPRLGPSPVKNGPALASYTRSGDKGGTVAEVLDPASGKKIALSPPDKKADSPVVVKNEGGVDAIHREDGELKRTRLKEDLSTEPVKGWPAGEKTGPILAAETRPDGKAVLLTKEADNKIMLRQPEGVRELPGRDAAIAFSGGNAMVALQNDAGRLSVVDAATGETRLLVAGSGHGIPSLVATKGGGMRLSYPHPLPPAESVPANASGQDLGGHFATEFKDGAWGQPTRLYMPESPVKNAAVAVEFTPPFAQAHYKPMDIGLAVNGRQIAKVDGRTPSGRYLYRVPMNALHYGTASQGDVPANEVTVTSKGIGPGNFHIAEKCSLYSLHDWTQGCVVAANPQEADQLAQLSTHDLRHGAHDLVLASNGTELPRSLKPGEPVEMQVGVFNAGDRTSPAVTLQALGNEEKNGDAQIPALAPFTGTQAKIKISAPQNWTPGKPLKLSVGVPVAGDGDQATNQLDYYLFRDMDPAIAGPVRASAVDVKALPADAIVEVPAGAGKAQPFESSIKSNRLWLRSPIPPQGNLQMTVTGKDASLVEVLDLFDTNGRVLKPESGHWPAYGSHVYMRLSLPSGATTLSDDTRLKLWWE
jgi:hypothetical protein